MEALGSVCVVPSYIARDIARYLHTAIETDLTGYQWRYRCSQCEHIFELVPEGVPTYSYNLVDVVCTVKYVTADNILFYQKLLPISIDPYWVVISTLDTRHPKNPDPHYPPYREYRIVGENFQSALANLERDQSSDKYLPRIAYTALHSADSFIKRWFEKCLPTTLNSRAELTWTVGRCVYSKDDATTPPRASTHKMYSRSQILLKIMIETAYGGEIIATVVNHFTSTALQVRGSSLIVAVRKLCGGLHFKRDFNDNPEFTRKIHQAIMRHFNTHSRWWLE